MNLDTMVIPVEEAKERAREYAAAVKREHSVEDEAIAAGFRAAARGLPIITLASTIQAGGFFDNGLPRLAIVRADAQLCFVNWDWWTDGTYRLQFSADEPGRGRGALVGQRTVHVAVGQRNRPPFGTWRGSTIAPNVPPRYRPRRGRLGRWHVLWEVEEWTLTPPRDPALLKHIRGDLWAVLAVWDLTDLERAVLAARA